LQKGVRHDDISNTSPLVASAITTPQSPIVIGTRPEAIAGELGVV
jgi:hypothetical protein